MINNELQKHITNISLGLIFLGLYLIYEKLQLNLRGIFR